MKKIAIFHYSISLSFFFYMSRIKQVIITIDLLNFHMTKLTQIDLQNFYKYDTYIDYSYYSFKFTSENCIAFKRHVKRHVPSKY